MSKLASSDLVTRTLGQIAATLPGASAVFRGHNLDFCCGGAKALAQAAAEGNVDLATLIEELAALEPEFQTLPEGPEALIDHILARYHTVHRQELPELLLLAEKVERRHAEHPEVPAGLTSLLETVAAELESHMQKEEQILFPLMRQGGHPMIGHPITMMRHEHDAHGENLRALMAVTHNLTIPAEACASWRALYAALRKFTDDLMMHIHTENNILFPNFGA